MKILLVGASGVLGGAVAAELGGRHDIVRAGRKGADITLDITDANTIRAAFEKIGPIDAVVSAAGSVKFGPLATLSAEDYGVGLADKLMGQVNLVLIGQRFVVEGGSFTLSSGILAEDPIVAGSSASMVNAAVNGFVRAAAIEIVPRRINAVSPGLLTESAAGFGPYFRGHEPVPAARAALAFSKSVEGALTGQVFRVF